MTVDPTAELDASPLYPGQIIGERYRVGDLLGGGGMGVVQAGTHVLLGTPVAIKVIRSDLKGDNEVVQRFVNEARAAAALKGEHIARVFDVGLLETGEPYMVMEQLDGVSLDQYVAGRGALTRAEAIDIILQVCEGLAEAHAAGLVHRDIKPANLFLTRRPDGQLSVKILDFGIAKRVDTASPALTDPGKSVGSPWYMSPEQMLTPSSVDQQADVWSLGVLLFELLTARLPFEGESMPQVCANVLSAPAPPPSQYRADLPPELDAIVLRCLEKEPARRLASVRELGQALSPFVPTSLHAAVAEPVPALDPLPVSSYDSLGPLQGPAATSARRTRPGRSTWPLAVALVAVVALLPRYWERYSDWGFASSASRAVFAAPPLLPDESSPEAAPPIERDPPRLLQYLDSGQAIPEEDAPRGAAARSPQPTNGETWRRAQQLTREHDAATRYGL